MMAHKLPINYAIIPGKMSQRVVDFLNKKMRKHPKLITVAQHGYMHENHGNKHQEYEFGKSRSGTP